MKTKFVLHGGFNKEKGYIKDEFFKEALQNTPKHVKVLLVFFAESEEYLELRIKQCKDQFEKNKGSRDLDLKMAIDKTFVEDCIWADVIFLSGGHTVKLLARLENLSNLKQLFDKKTIVGDSAGVNVLGEIFYSRKTKEISKGLGILPFKIVVHYAEDMGNPLAEIEPNLETLFLREYETVVKYY